MTDAERIAALEQLVKNYRAYLREIAPFSYNDGAYAKPLREQTDALLTKETEETPE